MTGQTGHEQAGHQQDGAGAAVEPATIGLDLHGRPLPRATQAPHAPVGHVWKRRPGSVRRTMTVEVDWPEGLPMQGHFIGRARDMMTPTDGGDPRILSTDEISGHFDDRRTIADVASNPPRADVAGLSGERAGSNLRRAIDHVLHADKQAGAPLYLLLDDLAGASLVCMMAWAGWHPGYIEEQIALAGEDFRAQSMAGVCIGFRPGSSALLRQPGRDGTHVSQVLPLPHPDDPQGWHDFAMTGNVAAFRRARLIDIWREGDLIRVESLFQDSSSQRDTTMRLAVHEYRLSATASAITGELLTLQATPGTLPYAECPAAMANIDVLLGTPMDALRETVLARLKRTAGCTHLNDMVRSLAEAPVLAQALDRD